MYVCKMYTHIHLIIQITVWTFIVHIRTYTHILPYTDNVISSSARRRRKCWSEIEHNESIEELFDRMTSSAANTAVPVVDMEVNNDDDDEVKRVEDEEQNFCKGIYIRMCISSTYMFTYMYI